MASYHFTKKASEDLAQIWNYTVDTWSENQADHYFQLLLDCCQDISDGTVYGKQYDGIYPGLLGKKAGKHIIFYRITNHDVVEIVRILHERMDLGKRIRE
ncbi:MAG: type II toxin-antitoxin system RelE/ParE family toxin [Bacteroidales bacterium]|nr:type II toxin-antitoxin system RelE/ParE family toxin [Bacteroidales bacterium]